MIEASRKREGMKKITVCLFIVFCTILLCFQVLKAADGEKKVAVISLSKETEACIECHRIYSPGIVSDWQKSRHALITPKDASSRPTVQKRISSDNIPQNLAGVAGKDFNAPTCATCHNSLIVNESGDVIQNRNHDFGSKLWVRIFGLIYSHPQPKEGRTYVIRNRDGLPLPATFGGERASDYLLDKKEQEKRQAAMEKGCRACHSRSWIEEHFKKFYLTIAEVDKMIETSTSVLADAWKKG